MNRDDHGTDRQRRFATICEELRPDLMRFAFWLGRDRQLAEDVVQEALLRAWKSFDGLTEESKAKSWLLTIVRREFARSFERKRLEVMDLDALVAAEADVLAADEDAALAEMREALFRLDDEYREPLVLQVMMGYSTQEIADQMGLQQGAVLTRLFRARARLRQELGVAAEPLPS
jgi:RNA polymerase sigma-70 factor (ECF subfamily)